MLGAPDLLTFAFRAAVLLLLAPLLWLPVAARYNEMLAAVAGWLAPGAELEAAGRHVLVVVNGRAAPLSVDGFILHYGLVLLAVLVLAAVRVGVAARAGWLVGLGAGCAGLHVLGLAALARGVAWSASGGASEDTVLTLFAALWSLPPAAAGGAWCLLYWLPMAVRPAPAADAGGAASVRRPEGGV